MFVIAAASEVGNTIGYWVGVVIAIPLLLLFIFACIRFVRWVWRS